MQLSVNGIVASGKSHYMSQCWPRSVLSYGVTRPQWDNLTNQDSFKGFFSVLLPIMCHIFKTTKKSNEINSAYSGYLMQ